MQWVYPKILPLSYSPKSEKFNHLEIDSNFVGMDVVVTEKMDGDKAIISREDSYVKTLSFISENYEEFLYCHICPNFQFGIPNGWKVCGEYLYAKHSIYYDSLADYFLCFAIWDDQNDCLSWDDTEWYCNEMGICLVPELYRGVYDQTIVEKLAEDVVKRGGEGIVVRNAEKFSYQDFQKNVAKYVRANFVATNDVYVSKELELNKLLE